MSQTLEQPQTQTALRLIAKRDELIACLSACALATRARSPNAALKCVLLTAGERELVLESMDLEMRIRRVARTVQIDARGAALVDCQMLLDAAEVADGDVLALELLAGRLVLSGDSTSRVFNTIAPEEFPPAMAEIDGALKIEMPLEAFGAAYRFIKYATGSVSGNYLWAGVLLEPDSAGKVLNLVSADPKQFAVTGIPCAAKGKDLSVIVQGAKLGNTIAALGEAEAEAETMLQIGVGQGAVRFECEDSIVWLTRLHGAFPPWEKSLPRDCDGVVRLGREDFIRFVRQSGNAATELDHTLILTADTRGLAARLRSPDGESSANLPCRIDGKPIVIGLDPRLLIASAQSMDGAEIEMGWRAPQQSVRLRCGPLTACIQSMDIPNA
jgi:DNA polymerase III sliding clamp (beta) subunit (PCNA family)